MQSSEGWKQFESTGRIEDYLSYKALQFAGKVEKDVHTEEGCIQQGEHPDAGIIECNRNGTKTDAYR